MSNQGYGRNPADYGPLPGEEVGYGQAAYPGQGAAYASQDTGYGQAGYGSQGAGYATQSTGYSTHGMDYGDQGATAHSPVSHASAAGAKGFVGSLFDFGFNSFVTPKVVKIVYAFVTVVLGLAALGLLVLAFEESAIIGIIALIIVCPLYFLFNLALWRILLELIMVIFRMSDDLRSIRESSESR